MKDTFLLVDCPICNTKQFHVIYSRVYDTGHIIGKRRINNVMCDNCGFMYMNPKPSAETLRSYYKETSSGDVYHEIRDGTRQGVLIKERKEFIEKYLDKAKCSSFLDIGCGQGDLLISLDIPYWEKSCVEPSDAVRRLKNTGIKIFKTPIERFKSGAKKYDAISCISSLEHFFDPNSVVGKLAALLKEDGYLFIEVPDSTKAVAQAAEFYSFEHLSHFTKGTLSKLLNKHGLSIVEYHTYVSVSNLRCVAKKVNDFIDKEVFDDREELLIALQKYKREREVFIEKLRRKIDPIIHEWKIANKRIAIYGAGIHTRFLLNIFDLGDLVCCLIDSDSKKWTNKFKDWNIYSPTQIPNLKIDAILISSHDFESEIYETIEANNFNSIPVFTCYRDLIQ